MTKRRVCVVITARPSYSRIKTALEAIRDEDSLVLQLVVSSSGILDRYGNITKHIEDDGFVIDSKLHTLVEGESIITMPKTTSLNLMELSTVFDTLKPDFVVTIADRYETIATAIAASYMNICLVHIQGGEITGSIDEKVRHAVTKLSDYHFVSTNLARDRVIKMGEAPHSVFVTGCPSIDLAARASVDQIPNFDPIAKYGGVGTLKRHPKDYIIVMQHPVTNEAKDARQQVLETLYAIKDIGMSTYWFWPNVDAGSDEVSKGIRSFRESHNPDNIHFFKNLSPRDFNHLLINAKAIIGNSSVAIRECSYLGISAVNIGTRQMSREHGHNVIHTEHNREEIKNAMLTFLTAKERPRADFLYGSGDSGKKIAKLLSQLPTITSKQLNY